MTIPIQIILYGSVLASLILAVALLSIASSRDKILKKYYSLKERGLSVKMRKRAEKLLEESRLKAQKIVTDAEIFTDEARSNFNDELIKTLANISKNISDEALRDIDAFRKAMFVETVRAKELIGRRVEAQFEQVESQVQAYKRQRLEKADEEVTKMLAEISRKVLAKALSQDEHRELVIQALEEAKKKHVF